jgi:hypothetical protein
MICNNGGLIQLNNGAVALTQEQQCSNLQLVGESKTMSSSRGTICQNLTTKEQYIAQQAQGAYIAMVCQPEAVFDLSTTTQAVKPTKVDIKALNKRLL